MFLKRRGENKTAGVALEKRGAGGVQNRQIDNLESEGSNDGKLVLMQKESRPVSCTHHGDRFIMTARTSSAAAEAAASSLDQRSKPFDTSTYKRILSMWNERCRKDGEQEELSLYDSRK